MVIVRVGLRVTVRPLIWLGLGLGLLPNGGLPFSQLPRRVVLQLPRAKPFPYEDYLLSQTSKPIYTNKAHPCQQRQ